MQKIRIDFDNPGLPQHISAVENDSQSRFFQATLYENGKAYTAPEGATYSIMYRGFGPQNQGWYDTINDGAGKRAACAVAGNVVTCEIARQALQVPGHVSIVLCVTTGKGYMLKSWPIECDCKNDRYDSTAEIQSFFYVTQISNESWTQAIQAVEELKNTIDPTLSVSGKAADAAKVGEAVNAEAERAKGVESQIKEDLDNNTISKKIHTGKNLFNKERATVGFIEDSVTIGYEQTINPSNTSASTDVIPINPNNAYTLSGCREIVVTDANKRKLSNVKYIKNKETLTLHPSDFRDKSALLFVSAYNANIGVDTQVEIGETPTEYEEYKEYDVFEQGKERIDNFPNVGFENRLSEAEKKLNEIKDIKKMRTVRSSQKIKVKGESKVILHLHKRKTEGAGTVNDVYLPFAASDFSDVRVKVGSIDIPYMLTSRIDGIDIIQDDRLGRNSSGQVLQNSDGEWYVGFGNAVKKSIDGGKTWANISTFELGKTWVVCEFLHDDTMLLSLKGVLYRSEKPYTSYTKVLDTNESYTQVFIHAENVHELPNHTVILGCYQGERVIRIYKSTDGGKNWNRCYYDDSGKYQHIHNMYIDIYAQPVAIYAGCDGGGGILKSTDSGETWIDLRNKNVPQATDEGVIYADESGYRMLSGETSVVGGYTFVKTYDDLTFTPNLGIGNGCFAMEKYKGLLIAPLLCSTNHRNTAIAASSNDGDDWDVIFTTSPLNHDNGASDGFRYMSKLSNGEKEELIIGCQSSTQPPIRITEGAYAEIVVDIPKEVSEITVESGYAGADYENSYNNHADTVERLVSYDLASSAKQENFVDGGKRLSFLYPPLVKNEDAYAMDFSYICKNPLTLEADLSNVSAITISYWCKNITGGFYTVIEENDSGKSYGFKTNFGFLYDLQNGDAICEFRSQQCMDVWSKIDFIIDFDNSSITLYVNGSKTKVKAKTSDNIKNQLDGLKKSKNFSMFRKLAGSPTGAIQHVDVFNGIKTEKQIYDGYNDGLTDMVNE